MVLSLTKTTPLTLIKEEVNVNTKEITQTPLRHINVGASWDTLSGTDKPDLDLIISTNNHNEVCFFNNKELFDGIITHFGDNRTGDGDGDDETISVNLDKLPENVTTLEVALASWNGFNFSHIQNEYVSITDVDTNEKIAQSKDGLTGSGQTLILATINKSDGVWTVNLLNKITAHTGVEYLKTKGNF